MEGFCGESLWTPIDNSNWSRTSTIDFSNCFKQTILIYVPCAWLWLSLAYEYYLIKNSNNLYIQWNFLNVGKLILTLLLLLSSVVELALSIYDAVTLDSIYPVTYVTPFIKACTYTVVLGLILAHRKKGIHTSGSLFLFWIFMSIYAILNYRLIFSTYWMGNESNPIYAESERTFVFKTIEFPVIVSQLLLAFFADLRSMFISPGEEITNTCPKEYASFPNQMVFEWVTPIIRLGYKRPLKVSDMWNLKMIYKTDYILNIFNRFWSKKKYDKELNTEVRRNIAIVLFITYWKMFCYTFFLKLVQTVLMFLSPVVLDYLITFMATPTDPNWKGYFLSFLLFMISFFDSIFNNQYEFYLGVLMMKVRTCLMSTVYKKSLVLSNDGRKDFSTGQIINLMAVDVEAMVNYINMINVLWSAPVQLLVCFYLLWQQLGIWPTIASAATLILLYPINSFYTNKMKMIQGLLMRQKDKRAKLIDEILNGMKIIKLYGWESSFKDKITNIRSQEVKHLNSSAYYSMGITFAFSCTTFIVSLISFVTFLLIDPNNTLTANKAFVTLSLLNLLRIPFALLPIAIMIGAMAKVSLVRINKFLSGDELEEEHVLSLGYNADTKEEILNNNSKNAIVIEDGTFSWNKNGEPVLKKINLKVETNSLVAVVGKFGSGKSSLAQALINDLRKISGFININGRISYIPQTAWILNKSFRDNIIFMNPFDQELYDKVVKICALNDDLKVFEAGDLTEIGEKGINLSGGQKQRVSIARACYNNSDIYILDDPLSSVDSHVGKYIFDKVIGPNGFLKNKTRVLITHKVPLLKNVDRIVVLKGGEISEQGTYDELIEAKGEFSEILNAYINEESQKDKEESLEQSVNERKMSAESSKSIKLTPKKEQSNKEKGRLIQEEKQEVGGVKFEVYKEFLLSMSIWFIIFTLLTFALASTFNIATNLWLTAWADDSLDPILANSTAQRNKRIGFYSMYGFIEAVFNLIATTLLNLGLIQASKNLHIMMLDKVLRAPMLFFDTTPIGRVLNRFTKDLDTVDVSLRFNFRFLLLQCFRGVVSIIIFAIETPIFLVIMLPLSILYVVIQKIYIATSRQLKRLESSTRSPIYSHFSETVQGTSSIRAYGLTDRFIEENHRRIDINNSCFYPGVAATRWLTVRLGFLGYIVVLMSGIFAVVYRKTLSPSLAGLAVSFSLSFTTLLNTLIKSYSDVETNIVSVERCFEYTKLETEAAAKSDFELDKDWPSKGVVKFKNYSTTYREDLSPVLNDLTFEIQSNEKVGIVGRTGAGKSTLTLAMFRILEPSQGTIEIDGIDIKTLGLDDLRSNLTIIPQDPFLYSDTLRMNLDPFSKYTDDEIWRALDLASLRDFVQSEAEGLNKLITEGGKNLSVGQRQLICLARALLRGTKVLILDEATASIDFETDELIQKTIRSAFAENTIITIAHRLNTIIDYDKVIVLENGKLKEFDSPTALLSNKDSIFYSMAKESGIV